MTRLHSVSLLLHLLALAMWLGGIAFFLIVFGPAVHDLKAGLGLRLLNRGRITFELLSWTAIGLLVVTGILNLVLRSQMTGAHLGQYYLTILSVKLLLFVAMVFVAASVSLRFFRFGGVATMVLGGVAAGFMLYVATELMEDLGASGLIGPAVAAWFPAVVGSLLGTLALLYQEDG